MNIALFVPAVHFYAPLALRSLPLSRSEHDVRAYLSPKLPPNDRVLGGIREILRTKGVRYLRDQVGLRAVYGGLNLLERCIGRPLDQRRWPEVPELLENRGVVTRRLDERGWDNVQRDLVEFDADVLITVFFNRIVPSRVYELPSVGSYNLHPGRLPEFRGTAPVFRQLEQGVGQAGCALHELTDDLDAGDVVDQRTTTVSADETVYSLYRRLARLGGSLLGTLIEDARAGTLSTSAQDESEAVTYGDFSAEAYGEFLRDRRWWSPRDLLFED